MLKFRIVSDYLPHFSSGTGLIVLPNLQDSTSIEHKLS